MQLDIVYKLADISLLANNHLFDETFVENEVIVSLERLKHKWFVSADVCGIIKVWQAIYKVTEAVISFELDGAISYNAVVELTNMLPQHKRNSLFDNSALIAVALKSCKINLVLLFPS